MITACLWGWVLTTLLRTPNKMTADTNSLLSVEFLPEGKTCFWVITQAFAERKRVLFYPLHIA